MTDAQMPESLKVAEGLAAIQQALDAGPTPGPWSAVVQADWPHPQDVYITAERWGAVARSRIDPSLPNVAIQRANLRLLAASGPTTWTAVLSHISALQSALKDRDAEIERLKKDAERSADWCSEVRQDREMVASALQALLKDPLNPETTEMAHLALGEHING